jgi:hypothetical protein
VSLRELPKTAYPIYRLSRQIRPSSIRATMIIKITPMTPMPP